MPMQPPMQNWSKQSVCLCANLTEDRPQPMTMRVLYSMIVVGLSRLQWTVRDLRGAPRAPSSDSGYERGAWAPSIRVDLAILYNYTCTSQCSSNQPVLEVVALLGHP